MQNQDIIKLLAGLGGALSLIGAIFYSMRIPFQEENKAQEKIEFLKVHEIKFTKY